VSFAVNYFNLVYIIIFRCTFCTALCGNCVHFLLQCSRAFCCIAGSTD